MVTGSAYSVVRYGDIDVCWRPELDGGGRHFGQDYLPLVRHLFGHVGRVFEFCAGPAFIGFSLLAHGLCESLALADVNGAAVAAMRETVQRNGLDDRVAVYQSDGLADIPDHERWDLVVSNPPHFRRSVGAVRSLISDDPDWSVHRAFYRAVGGYLAPAGSVLIQENSEASTFEEFLPMIQNGGLRHVQTFGYTGNGHRKFYFIWSIKALPGMITHCDRPGAAVS